MSIISVTSPEGRTRYVGFATPWVDKAEDAFVFDNDTEAQEHIDNPWTAVYARGAVPGWQAAIVR